MAACSTMTSLDPGYMFVSRSEGAASTLPKYTPRPGISNYVLQNVTSNSFIGPPPASIIELAVRKVVPLSSSRWLVHWKYRAPYDGDMLENDDDALPPDKFGKEGIRALRRDQNNHVLAALDDPRESSTPAPDDATQGSPQQDDDGSGAVTPLADTSPPAVQ